MKGLNGRFGLGNKSALSLGIDSYTVINRYNGKKFRFEVYLDNVVSTTAKFGKDGKNENISVLVPQPTEDGNTIDKEFIFYYEKTDEPNGLEVVVPIKKFQKKEVFRAIEEQLMYMPNVVFKYKKQGSISYETIDIEAKVLYRDKNIVISESTVYDVPHILLGTDDGLVAYGAIDFPALELDPKRGAVGLILDINDVEVTPSRESIIYSAKTGKAVIDSYNKIVSTATKLINKDLQEATSYFDWLVKAAGVRTALFSSHSSGQRTAIQQLAGIIDVDSINKIYYKSKDLNKLFASDIKTMVTDKLLIRNYSYDSYNKKVTRTKIKVVSALVGFMIFITDGASDKYKDRYIFQILANNHSFIVIKRSEGWEHTIESKLIGEDNSIESYDAVIVPDDVMDGYLAEELDGNQVIDDESLTVTVDSARLARLRKQEEKILYHDGRIVNDDIIFQSKEIKINKITSTFIGKTVVYGDFSDREMIIKIFNLLPYKVNSLILDHTFPYSFRNSAIMQSYEDQLIKDNIKSYSPILVSKDTKKYFENRSNCIHISDFIIDTYKDGKLIFNSVIVDAMTYHEISKILKILPSHDMEIYEDKRTINFYSKEFVKIKIFNAIKEHSHKYTPLLNIMPKCIEYEYGKNYLDIEILNDLLIYINDYLPEALCDKIDEITDVHIINVDIIKKVMEYTEFYKPYISILRNMSYVSDLDMVEVLDTLISKHEEKPLPLGIF